MQTDLKQLHITWSILVRIIVFEVKFALAVFLCTWPQTMRRSEIRTSKVLMGFRCVAIQSKTQKYVKMPLPRIMLNNSNFNTDQSNSDNDFCHNSAALN